MERLLSSLSSRWRDSVISSQVEPNMNNQSSVIVVTISFLLRGLLVLVLLCWTSVVKADDHDNFNFVSTTSAVRSRLGFDMMGVKRFEIDNGSSYFFVNATNIVGQTPIIVFEETNGTNYYAFAASPESTVMFAEARPSSQEPFPPVQQVSIPSTSVQLILITCGFSTNCISTEMYRIPLRRRQTRTVLEYYYHSRADPQSPFSERLGFGFVNDNDNDSFSFMFAAENAGQFSVFENSTNHIINRIDGIADSIDGSLFFRIIDNGKGWIFSQMN